MNDQIKAFLELLAAFLKEFIVRLGAKSPTFFVILQYIAALTAMIAGIPSALEVYGVELPAVIQPLATKAIWIAGLAAYFFAKLPVSDQSEKKGSLPLTDKK
jgi:hypothetical protein